MSDNKKILYVTKPSLPPLEEFIPYLNKIWETRILTNYGPFCQEFEEALKSYLGVEYVSVVVNGTTGLMLALKALEINGEVITTPFSFVASAQVLQWNNITPVFVDIEPDTLNIDPGKIEAAITPHTTAIMPVHVFGNPCKTGLIEDIAGRNNLPVIYDSCHAFGVKSENKSIADNGDISVFSFHATKAFNTFEGGAVICRTEKLKKKIDSLRNFGIQDEITIDGIGINGKMNEFQAALGLLQLLCFDNEVLKRRKIADYYTACLKDIPGVSPISCQSETRTTFSFFPVLINPEKYGNTCDTLYNELKRNNIFTRRYFYPLISDLPLYKGLPSASALNLRHSQVLAGQVLCLPIYADLEFCEIDRILKTIRTTAR